MEATAIAIDALVADVIDTMPERLRQSGRVEVEINRAFSDFLGERGKITDTDIARCETILHEAMHRHGIEVADHRPAPAALKPIDGPDISHCKDSLSTLVGAASATTFDGSEHMAKAAADRAWRDVTYQLHRWALPPGVRTELANAARIDIEINSRGVVSPPNNAQGG